MSDLPDIPWLADPANRRKRWLAGVSGGADSVAMLHLLAKAGFRKVVVCHLDHGLRGRASAGDARFVAKLAGELGYPCEIAKADVVTRMKEKGESMETAARGARHAFYADCAAAHRCRRMLLAHHLDDQAETVLWNLLRGSHGLKGMAPEKILVTGSGGKLEIHRPLLGVRGAELRAWLKDRGFKWREDSTNALPVAVRNRLRNEAFPLLGEISGRDAAVFLARGAADARDSEELERWALERADVMDPQGRLHVRVLQGLPVALRRAALRNYLREQGISNPDRAMIDRGLCLLEPEGPAVVNLPAGRVLRRRSARLWVDR